MADGSSQRRHEDLTQDPERLHKKIINKIVSNESEAERKAMPTAHHRNPQNSSKHRSVFAKLFNSGKKPKNEEDAVAGEHSSEGKAEVDDVKPSVPGFLGASDEHKGLEDEADR